MLKVVLSIERWSGRSIVFSNSCRFLNCLRFDFGFQFGGFGADDGRRVGGALLYAARDIIEEFERARPFPKAQGGCCRDML